MPRWSEFTCSYWGPFRQGLTEVDTEIELEVPSMLFSVWDRPTGGRYAPAFKQNVGVGKVHRGVLEYDVPALWVADVDSKEAGHAQ
jgi:CRISPR-associated protein Cas5d